MRDDEISEHCLCDKCAGHECGADNPEERANEEKRAREARDQLMREEGAKVALESILSSFDSLDSYGEEEGYPLVSLLDVQNRVELIKERSLRSPDQKQLPTAVEDITPEGAAIVQKYKEQAREDVLQKAINILKDGIANMPDFIIPEVKQGKIDACEWMIEKLESLRSGVKE